MQSNAINIYLVNLLFDKFACDIKLSFWGDSFLFDNV